MNATTSNGAIELTLSPAFRGTLSASTSNGRVTLPESGNGMTVSRSGKTAATLTVGEGGPASEVRTSNGRITVSRAASRG